MRQIFSFVLTLLFGLLATNSMAADKTITAPGQTIIRKPLLTALIKDQKMVGKVEVKEIQFTPYQKTGLHLHPCPVVGYIVQGTVLFQVEGQPEKTLKTGDAFFEPPNDKILHFDAQDQPVKFIAYYLLGQSETELIKMLQ